jgi:tetratricopeptide (TPR) repeat protein
VTLAPDNTLALKALSSINHYMGRYDEGERLARQAVELNPHDPDTLAQLGWRLAVRGKFDEGIPILKHAIERTVNPPGWYFHLVAIDFYLKGDYEQMLQVAERSAVDGSGFSQALIAIAAGALGNHDTAQQALEKMAKFEAFANDPTAFFHRHGATDEITNVLVAGLQEVRRSVSGL